MVQILELEEVPMGLILQVEVSAHGVDFGGRGSAHGASHEGSAHGVGLKGGIHGTSFIGGAHGSGHEGGAQGIGLRGGAHGAGFASFVKDSKDMDCTKNGEGGTLSNSKKHACKPSGTFYAWVVRENGQAVI
ncbi:unnamed protein product [Ilex paraguariensis]|uniref:Uncharacterized protein n=1 Tax=Ilex paraguariensis TaxID=185542 RepID=A0ABC8TRC5_9AQUA